MRPAIQFLVKNTKNTSKSPDPDTVKIANYKEDKIYEYGDFSSYILLYNNSLGFEFEPIEFQGFTNYILSEIIYIKNIPHIVSCLSNQKGTDSLQNVFLCNMQGEIIKQISVENNLNTIYSSRDKFVLASANKFHIYSNELELLKTIDDITFAAGFFDIDKDDKPEFIAFKNNNLIIFSDDFKNQTRFEIEHEFQPYSKGKYIKILEENDIADFQYYSKNFYYFFSYQKNKLSVFKYPFYVLIFAFWFTLIFILMKFNTKRLEKEKEKLEEIVDERTVQLKQSNEELKAQKEEISSQAEELEFKNEHLKKTMTDTLVHDLKNPLGQILAKTTDSDVTNLSNRMLRLVRNLLDVDKYEETEFKINAGKFEIQSVFEALKETFSVNLKQKNIRLVFPEKNAIIKGEKELIARVFENLLSNAIRYSPQNKAIEISLSKNNEDAVLLGVKNYGNPIPQEQLSHIFDKFKHFDKKETNFHNSTGLGLTFCKMVIEAHKQTILAKNIEDGVLFEFTLNGKIKSGTQVISTKEKQIILTEEEKQKVKPYLDELLDTNIYQISQILNLINQIPDNSQNLIKLKEELQNAAFSSNKELFNEVLESIR